MKKGIAVITAVVVLTISGLALAQMNDKGKEMMADKAGMMEGKGGMMGMMEGKGMMGVMKMCQSMMNKPSMVAVGNGVVVLSGKKLYKYDANLNLVKEAEIKGEAMGDGKMCSKCKMMGKGMDMDNDDDDKAPTVGTDEHASHHPEK